jgi:hypothetical protein
MKKTSFAYSSTDEEEEVSFKRRQTSIRVKWSVDELELLATAFGGLGKPPCSDAVVQLQQKHPVLLKRTVAQIKSRAWHFINTGR